MNLINRTIIAAALCFSGASLAAEIRVEVEVPYSTLLSREQGAAQIVSTTIDVPYKDGGFFSGGQPSDQELKSASERVLVEAPVAILRKFLADKPSKNIQQSEATLLQNASGLVYEISASPDVDVERKVIVFTVNGRVNTNHVDQIAGYQPTEADLSKARAASKEALLNKYIKGLDSSKIDAIEKNKSAVMARADDLVSDIQVRSHKVISDRKVIAYAVQGEVNDALFDKVLFGDVEKNATGEGSLFAYLIIPRIQSEVTSFDATVKSKVENASGTSTQEQTTEAMGNAANGAIEETNASVATRRVAESKTVSGQSTQKLANVVWKTADAKGIDAQLNKHLTVAGFELINFDDVMGECGNGLEAKLVRDEILLSESGQYSSDTRRQINRAVRDCEISFYAVGTMDVDSIRTTRSGATEVSVVVNIQVTNHESRLPKNVASVGPSRYEGLGSSVEQATDDALIKAASQASDVILATLRTKGIQ